MFKVGKKNNWRYFRHNLCCKITAHNVIFLWIIHSILGDFHEIWISNSHCFLAKLSLVKSRSDGCHYTLLVKSTLIHVLVLCRQARSLCLNSIDQDAWCWMGAHTHILPIRDWYNEICYKRNFLHGWLLVGLDLFNDDTRPSRHISRPTQVNTSWVVFILKTITQVWSYCPRLGLVEANELHHIR